MQRKVLDSLIARGSFVGIIAPKTLDVAAALQNFAHSLSGSAPFSFVEYSSREISAKEFLKKWRKAQEVGEAKNVFVIFNRELDEESKKLLFSMRMTIVLVEKGNFLDDELLFELDALSNFPRDFFWWCAPKPLKKRFRHLAPAVKGAMIQPFNSVEALQNQAEKAAEIFRNLLKIRILGENGLEGWPRIFRRFFIPFCLLALICPFLYPTKIVSNPSMTRNMKAEMQIYAEAPYFDYTFDGKESLERIGRYAVGRFVALVTNEKTLGDYVAETLEKNGFAKDSWKKERLHIPPEGISLRFEFPEKLINSEYDLMAPAWHYFTHIIADSIAYVTETYYPKATAKNRLHPAWDVASRAGARILAPFSGKAWTFSDERGGIVIGIADKERVILFMHCNQLLYLDGQNVMQGDPLATVGTTGHTTGPHVHLVTGIVSKNGEKRLGNVRYTVVNPVTWFLSGK